MVHAVTNNRLCWPRWQVQWCWIEEGRPNGKMERDEKSPFCYHSSRRRTLFIDWIFSRPCNFGTLYFAHNKGTYAGLLSSPCSCIPGCARRSNYTFFIMSLIYRKRKGRAGKWWECDMYVQATTRRGEQYRCFQSTQAYLLQTCAPRPKETRWGRDKRTGWNRQGAHSSASALLSAECFWLRKVWKRVEGTRINWHRGGSSDSKYSWWCLAHYSSITMPTQHLKLSFNK